MPSVDKIILEIAEELTNEKNEECSEHSAEEHSEKNELPPQPNQHQKVGKLLYTFTLL